MKNYHTISDAVNNLFQEGYTIDYTTEAGEVCCADHLSLIKLPGDDFEIDKIYRFQQRKSLNGETVVMAVSSPGQKVKGLMVNVYGMYEKKR